MLRLPAFRFHQPSTLEDALARLGDSGPSVRVDAGGTDLWPNMKRRHQSAASVVSLMKIDELRGISTAENGGEGPTLSIGATTLLDDVARSGEVRERFPALARAVASISSPPLRNMATLGGNLCLDTRCTYYNQTEEWRRSIDYCLKEKGTVCWVAPGSSTCWAHSASDSAPMLQALEASVILRSSEQERKIAVGDLFANDGIQYLSIQPGEVLTGVQLPASSSNERCATAFWKLRRRGSIDFAVLSAAVALWLGADGTIRKARVVLGAVASRPLPVPAAEEILVGQPPDPDVLRAAARAARRAATPMDNTDFKTQWRGVMVERYTEAALREAAGLEQDRPAPPHP
jgi:4-hydroxybenzoyl-CoA reductase subunit beta